jgi:hypothetical protein
MSTAQTMLLEPSVQSLFLQMRLNGNVLATGTGFVVNTPRGPALITNRHNVTGCNNTTGFPLSPTGHVPDELVIVHNKTASLGQWIERVEPILHNGSPLWIEHPILGLKADFVALLLTEISDVALYPYDLNLNINIKVSPSDTVSVVGFPFGLTGGGALAIWATGFMATEPGIDYDNLPVFLIDCRARPGQSGSAVIAHRNGGMVSLDDWSMAVYTDPVTRLLGIYSGRINDQSDLGIVWKQSAITELVNSI